MEAAGYHEMSVNVSKHVVIQENSYYHRRHIANKSRTALYLLLYRFVKCQPNNLACSGFFTNIRNLCLGQEEGVQRNSRHQNVQKKEAAQKL